MRKVCRMAVCLLLVLSLMPVSMAGCSFLKKPLEDLFSASADAQPTNPQSTSLPTQPTQPVEVEAEGLQPLEILLGRQYLGEWSETTYVHLAHVSWEDLALGQKSAEAYPALEKALLERSKETAEWSEGLFQSILPDAREQAADMGSDFYGFLHETVALVQRADERILSVRNDYYAYTGGARPYYGTNVINLDPVTGDPVRLEQVLANWQRLPDLLKQALLEKYPELEQGAFGDLQEIFLKYDQEDYAWTLDYQGITFYFGMAEIAPAMAGSLSVTLWFDQYPELFIETFKEIPNQGYGQMMVINNETAVDLNPEDDQRDTVRVSVDREGTLYITKNDETLVNDRTFTYDNGAEAYLVTPDNKQFYLYVDTASDNDYSTLWVYDLSGEGIRLVTAIDGEGFAGYWNEDYPLGETWFAKVFNDPSCFALSSRVDVLGTLSGSRNYHMNPENGVPVADEDFYTLQPDRAPLITKMSIKVKLLPGETDMQVPAGTKLWFLRSDKETYVDMRLADGTECRIYITRQGWRCYVNGILEDDCFDGIMYAG